MATGIQKFNPLGGLQMDNDPNYVRDGDYVSARNVRGLTDNTESTGSVVPIKGTVSAFDIPATTTAQNKKYRVFHNDINTTSRTLTLYRTDGSSFIVFTYLDGANLAATAAAFAAEVATEIAAATPVQTATLTLGSGNAYTDFELTTITGYEYTLVSTGANEVTIQCIREAWDPSLFDGTTAHVIGSYDLLGDLFVVSTPNTELSSTATYTATAATSAGLIRITTSAPHLLTSGYSYRIMTNVGTVPTIGTWIIINVTATEFTLANSVFTGTSASTSITIMSNGVSITEVGVGVFNNNTETWTYTTLLKTKEIYSSTKKQVDMQGEENNIRKSIYWTDDYGLPRAFYYEGDYIANGAITAINSDGLYAYDLIAEETNLFVFDSGSNLTITGQAQAGGAVTSGNWRYTFRFLTASLATTDVAELTNPISVFAASTAATSAHIYGDVADTVTGKINELQLTGIVPGLFKYVELIGINYVDNAIVGYVLSRTELDGISDTLVLRHTGNESDITDFDLSLLSVNSIKYNTAKNMRIIDSRMVLSNLTSRAVEDLSEWAATIEHELLSSSIVGVRELANGTFRLGEYLIPTNVTEKVGYMDNEVYRIGIRGRFRDTGEISQVFWIDDIRIDTSATNITSPNRRVAGLSNFDLTSADGLDVYVRYISLSNIDLDYLVDGLPVRDIFSELMIERAECVPEVLACGGAALTIYDAAYGDATGLITGAGEYVYISGDIDSSSTTTPVFPGAAPGDSRKVVKLYCPDIYCLGNTISYVAGDIVYNYGNPTAMSPNPANIWRSSVPADYFSSTIEYNGNLDNTPTTHTVNSTLYIDSFEGPTTFGGLTYDYSQQVYNTITAAPTGTLTWANRSGLLIESNTDLLNGGPGTDYGFYYIQYYREIDYVDEDDNKYGVRGSTIYVPTGTVYEIDSSSPSSLSGLLVFGGDTFTSKFYVKHRAATAADIGGAGGLGFYAQTRVNHQMIDRSADVPVGSWGFPAIDIILWLEEASTLVDSPAYNVGYTINDSAQVFAAFDENATNSSDFPNRIIWSDIKVQNSAVDGYRNYLPLNFKDLDLSFGEITHHDNVNGELVTWQIRKLQRQYFNTRGELDSTGLGIIIGDGSVLSRDGQTMSSIGTKHKWSVIKGKSAQGNDTMYWINTELKKAMRLGYDGTVAISDIKGVRSFFANNLTWVEDFDTPADGLGICGFWDDRYSEAGWTVRGERDEIGAWDVGTTYAAGDVVAYTPFEYESFYYTEEFYVANDASLGIDPGTGDLAEATFDINITANGTTPNSATFVTLILGDVSSGVIQVDNGPLLIVDNFALTLAGMNQGTIDTALAAATVDAGWTVTATYLSAASITWYVSPDAGGYVGEPLSVGGLNWGATATPFILAGVNAEQAISLYDGASHVVDIIPSTFEWFCDWNGSGTITPQDLIDFQSALDAELETGYVATVNTYTGVIGNVNTNVTISPPQEVGAAYNGFTIEPGSGAAMTFPDTEMEGGSDVGPWDIVPRDDGDYYSNFTIIYNEVKDKFTHFASFMPNIYLQWTGTYLSPDNSVDGDSGDIYQHNKGNYCSWYNEGLEEEGYLEGVINEYPDEVKWPTAMRVQSDIVPTRFEFTTYSQESFLNDDEFETFERYHESAIKEDSTGTDINDGDTSLLYGNWMKCKIFFEVGVYQKLYNFIVKFRISARNSGK